MLRGVYLNVIVLQVPITEQRVSFAFEKDLQRICPDLGPQQLGLMEVMDNAQINRYDHVFLSMKSYD